MSKKGEIQVMPLLTKVKKRGNPGDAIAHECQEKREFRLCNCSQMSRKEENPGYAIAHKCQEKRENLIMPLLTNAKK